MHETRAREIELRTAQRKGRLMETDDCLTVIR